MLLGSITWYDYFNVAFINANADFPLQIDLERGVVVDTQINQHLIARNSSLHQRICEVLGRLDLETHIIAFTTEQRKVVKVNLPQLQLDFEVNNTCIRSLQYKDAYVCREQYPYFVFISYQIDLSYNCRHLVWV